MSTTTTRRPSATAAAATEQPPFLTARNPRALAEIVLGHPVDWAGIDDPDALLEEVLLTPREQLFDPRHGSPVYLGFRLDDSGAVIEAPAHEPQVGPTPESDDAPQLPDTITSLKDLQPVIGNLGEAKVRSVVPSRAGGWTVELAAGGKPAQRLIDAVFDRRVLDELLPIHIVDLGWTPDGAQWTDTGSFFHEAAEFFDPIQGGLGDCWLIAAMSSVAWALPGTIQDASRATGTNNQQFTHRFVYRDPGDGTQRTFEASDQTLVFSGTTSPLYARSSETGEIWPGVVEKAFAQWRQGTTNDRPNLTVLNGGDPVWASAALSGRTPHYTGHSGQTATALTTLVKQHCVSYRTIDPMTAWTYGTAPAGLSYADATIVANHAYSVLGWTSGPVLARAYQAALARTTGIARERIAREGAALLNPAILTRDYVVLRNPWGYHEATAGARHGAIAMRDAGFWRSIDLDVSDGVFAIDFSTYQQYFAGTGVAL
jgi:hypothetical protein